MIAANTSRPFNSLYESRKAMQPCNVYIQKLSLTYKWRDALRREIILSISLFCIFSFQMVSQYYHGSIVMVRRLAENLISVVLTQTLSPFCVAWSLSYALAYICQICERRYFITGQHCSKLMSITSQVRVCIKHW